MKATKLHSAVGALWFGLLAVSAGDTNIIVWGNGGVTSVPDLPTNAIAVTGGDSHGLVLLADQTVRTWGGFPLGGSIVPPTDATNLVGIAAGGSHAAAVRSDGSVALWGWLGGVYPARVSSEATNVMALGVGPGAQHALALRADGTVVDWGYAGTTNVPPEALNIVSVAAGSWHSLALRSDGRVIAWGDNSRGQANVPASATNIVAVAVTWYGNIALRADGRILTWGQSPNIPSPATLTDVIEVAGRGGDFDSAGMVLRRNGVVVAAGAPPTATNIMAIGGSGSVCMAVKAAGPPIFPLRAVRRTVAAGQTAYFRLRAVGTLPMSYQWSFQGTNLTGGTDAVLVVSNAVPGKAGSYSLVASNALGVATNSDLELVVVPFVITRQPTNQSVYVGANPTLRVAVLGQSPAFQWSLNGTNIPWGTNGSLNVTNIQLSDAGTYSVSVSNEFGVVVSSNAFVSVWPILVTESPQDRVIFRGGSATFSIAAQASSALSYQWQFNGVDLPGATENMLTMNDVQYEQAGTYAVIASTASAVVTNRATLAVVPVAAWGRGSFGRTNVPADLTNVVALAAGDLHNLALISDGTVRAWGSSGDRTNVPVDLTNAVAISAGDWGSLALLADGTIAAWGFNNRGQTNVPPELTNVVAVSAGGYHNLALESDGTVVAWGQNDSGQTNVPAGLADVVAIAAGGSHSLGLKKDGAVVAWGSNGNGQTNVPTGVSNVVAIAAGTIHSVALRANGTPVVWGSSNYGLQSIPLSATNIVAIDAGYGHCVALRDDGTVVAWGYYWDGGTNIPTGLRNVVAIAAGDFHNLALIGGDPSQTQALVANPAWGVAGFRISAPTISGRVYRVEHKDSLSDSNWVAHPLFAGTGGVVTVTDLTATGAQRFYRVRRW
jgi:alpha-tubulin suppressor-like RCC1 family protein